jgi:putative FmdB family regulatory protein
MPVLYDFKCEKCGATREEFAEWDDKKTLSCGACGANMLRQVPRAGITGLSKNVPSRCGTPRHNGHEECVYERPDPVNDCAIQFRAIEKAGKMTPIMAKHATYKMAKLREQDAKGQIKKVDYGVTGHPTGAKITAA